MLLKSTFLAFKKSCPRGGGGEFGKNPKEFSYIMSNKINEGGKKGEYIYRQFGSFYDTPGKLAQGLRGH